MNSYEDIILTNINKSYGPKKVLNDFSAVFSGGGITCIMGPSGCGKTTLLRLILELETADSGFISGTKGAASAAFQEDRLVPGLSAVGNLTLACANVSRQDLHRQLLQVDLAPGDLECPVRELSGGMKRRVALVRAMAAPSVLVVLDEPFKGLDTDTRRRVMNYIKEARRGRTMLVVTHDFADADDLGGNILKMDMLQGRNS